MKAQFPPVLDINSTTAVNKLIHAFETYGCCYITGHGLSETDIQDTLSATKALFGLPQDEKAAIPLCQKEGFIRGFLSLGKESGSADLFEVKEGFSYGYNLPKEAQGTNPLEGPNIWPRITGNSEWSEKHQQVLETYFTTMSTVALQVSRILATALGQDEDEFISLCQNGDRISLMRLFHYFPQSFADEFKASNPHEQDKALIGSSPHTDWGFLTLILQENVPGLEVFTNGEWVRPTLVPGALFVNIGDYVALLSNGRFVSPIHRVSTPTEERHSLVYFFYPNYEAVLPHTSSSSSAKGIGGHSKQEGFHTASKFNNLLDGTIQDHEHNLSFGEYISRKWAGVQRN